MSYLNKFKLEAWEKAYWWFANQGYQDSQSEFYAKQFEVYALENMGEEVIMDDLLSDFVADILYAEKAEADKERSRHNV